MNCPLLVPLGLYTVESQPITEMTPDIPCSFIYLRQSTESPMKYSDAVPPESRRIILLYANNGIRGCPRSFLHSSPPQVDISQVCCLLPFSSNFALKINV